jgi:hypothetical protein
MLKGISPGLLHIHGRHGPWRRDRVGRCQLHGLGPCQTAGLPAGVDAAQVLDAALFLDEYVPHAAFTMPVVGDASAVPPAMLDLSAPPGTPWRTVPRVAGAPRVLHPRPRRFYCGGDG